MISKSIPAVALIQRSANQGRWVAAICAAPTVLAHLGLLDRRNATVYPGMEEEMFSAIVKLRNTCSSVSRVPSSCKSISLLSSPSWMIATRSQSLETRSMLWEKKKTVLPA